jgi:hypothetical protein
MSSGSSTPDTHNPKTRKNTTRLRAVWVSR